MYLPAFAAIQSDLQTPASAVSASLSLFLAGFAVAQLLWGRSLTIMVASLFCCWVYPSSRWAVWACCGLKMPPVCWYCALFRPLAFVRHRLSGRRWSPIIILHKSKPHLCHHYAIGRVIPGISAVIRQLDLVHFHGRPFSPPCLPLP